MLHASQSEEDGGNYVWKGVPPKAKDGYWVGYFVELVFPADTEGPLSIVHNDFIFTTPGWTNPNTLPYPDCNGEDCIGILV